MWHVWNRVSSFTVHWYQIIIFASAICGNLKRNFTIQLFLPPCSTFLVKKLQFPSSAWLTVVVLLSLSFTMFVQRKRINYHNQRDWMLIFFSSTMVNFVKKNTVHFLNMIDCSDNTLSLSFTMFKEKGSIATIKAIGCLSGSLFMILSFSQSGAFVLEESSRAEGEK